MPQLTLADLRAAIDRAIEVRRASKATHTERLLADALISQLGQGSLVDINKRLEAWAIGADAHVSDASEALDDAGIGPGPYPFSTIGDRIRRLAAQRDALKGKP